MSSHLCGAAVTVTALLLGTPAWAGEQATPTDRRHFVACPVVRDTSTQPCWLAEYEGEWYYLGAQGSSASAFYPPQLGHLALVEGTVTNGPRVCGGVQLSPVRVSVLPELNPACNTVLPAEAGFTPARSPLAPAPKFPDTAREFAIPFDFDSTYLTLHTTRIVEEAARVAKASGAAAIVVHARRGATLLSNGQLMTEGPRIAEARAVRMAENLAGLGIPADRVRVSWQREPDPADGIADPDSRRVTITLTQAAAACDRACLLAIADQFVNSLAKRDPAGLPFAPSVKVTENGVAMKIGDGLWKLGARSMNRRDAFADVTNGQVAVWAVLDDGGGPALLSVRLKVQNRRIQEVESVVARKGSHALFSPDAFAALPSAYQEVLEPVRRSTRARLVAIADGYFEGIAKHDSALVASAADCNRFENGVRMTNRPGAPATPRACATAVDRLTHIKAVPDRRYNLVDEERGVVLSMVMFDIPADAAATPPREGRMLLLAEVFKIAGGEIERIETVMHNLPYGTRSVW
jgi:hypothetical protein